MKVNQAAYRIAPMCRLLGVSPSGYYAYWKREPSARSKRDAQLKARIQAIHSWSRGTYGAPRIHAELADEGTHVGRKRVARLLRELGLAGVSRRKRTRTTRREHDARPAPDLVERHCVASRPDALWVADVTYVPTWARFVYLAVVVDAFSRRVVGGSMATHLRTELVLEALNMALWQRRPASVIHHSDQGCQTGLKESSQHGFVEPIVSDFVKPPQEFSNQGPFSVAHSTSQQRHRVLLPKSD